MDPLSFASVYRTAAILAAFSRVDGSGDIQSLGQESLAFVAPPVATRWWDAIGRVIQWCLAQLGAGRRASLDAVRAPDHPSDPMGRWLLRLPASISPLGAGEAARPLVSHFSFCESSDLHDPRTRL